MMDDNNIFVNCLKEIYKRLDNLEYVCEAREYTLNDDEMGSIFYCRDTIWKVLKENGKLE